MIVDEFGNNTEFPIPKLYKLLIDYEVIMIMIGKKKKVEHELNEKRISIPYGKI